jgi:multicomponent Na+:H+ antiporter subunit G
MSAMHHVVTDMFLTLTVIACWLGVLGMWRMREPIQALHYLSFPAALGSITLAVAVGCQTGFSQATAKCLAIAVVLIAINSIVAHTTARALRAREFSHWEPRPGEGIEFMSSEPKP